MATVGVEKFFDRMEEVERHSQFVGHHTGYLTMGYFHVRTAPLYENPGDCQPVCYRTIVQIDTFVLPPEGGDADDAVDQDAMMADVEAKLYELMENAERIPYGLWRMDCKSADDARHVFQTLESILLGSDVMDLRVKLVELEHELPHSSVECRYGAVEGDLDFIWELPSHEIEA